MEPNSSSLDSNSPTIDRLNSWTLQLYSIQHLDQAIKCFSAEVYEVFQCRSVVYFKYMGAFSSIVATHAEGIPFLEVRGKGLNFSKDQQFNPIRDLLKLDSNKSFTEMVSEIIPNHDYEYSLCISGGEVRGVFVYGDMDPNHLRSSLYKSMERIFSHWLNEIYLIEKNHDLIRNEPVTGLLNKKTFVEYAAMEVGRAQRIKHPVSFIYLKLNHLNVLRGQINLDRYQGLLKMISSILLRSTRKTDYVSSFHDGEFGVLAPHMSLRNGRNKCIQLKKSLESYQYFDDLNQNFTVEFSICLSEYPTLAHDYEDLYLSATQKILISDKAGLILEATKPDGFEPDFKYNEDIK